MNFKRAIFIPAAFLLFSQCTGPFTGKGKVITETRNVTSFKDVTMEGAANVTIRNGANQSVSVKGYENLVPLVETSVKDSELVISMKSKVILNNQNIEIEITTPMLNSIALDGTGNVQIDSFNTSKMTLTLSGAGNMKFANSECDSVYATLSGTGNMYVNATKYLSAEVNGVGNIEYAGNPVVDSHVSGVGKVRKK